MRAFHRLALPATLIVLAGSALGAQTPSPSGHWVGSLQVPGNAIPIEIDIVRGATGALEGTASMPAENLKGLPLTTVSLDGKTFKFSARKDQPFVGTMSDDGKWIVGELAIDTYKVPLTFSRAGDAHVEPPLKSPAISKELEGTWSGSIQAGGAALRVLVTMANGPDQMATGRLINLDQGETELPILITERGTSVTFTSPIVQGSFTGTLNAAKSELTGTWQQGPASVPVTLVRKPAAR